MAAVGTKKPLGQLGVSLTFPYNFQEAMGNRPDMYFPSYGGEPYPVLVGTDFQSEYHEEKRRNAHQSVRNGIQANNTKERLLLTGIHNYHVPRPVLGQRIFANPSLGDSSVSSARRDGNTAPFRIVEDNGSMQGGAVTSAGRDFYNSRLQSRIEELNRMNTLAQGFAVPSGQPYMSSDNTKMGPAAKVNFFLLLDLITDDVTQGLSRFSFDNLKMMLQDFFDFTPTATENDFQDMLSMIDTLLETLRDGMSENPSITISLQDNAYSQTLLLIVETMRMYVSKMFANMYLSERDRRTLSKSLISSLDFTKIMRARSDKELIQVARKGNTRINQAAENFDDDDDVNDDDNNDGHFSKPTEAREDEEQPGTGRAPFAGEGADPNRKRYGESRGQYTQVAWFGEATAEDAPSVVAPLSLSGFDPESQIPGQDPSLLLGSLNAVIEQELESVGKTANDTRSDYDIINALYPDPITFVNNVAKALEERGLSPAQIARAMSMVPLGSTVFAQYISDNTGDLNPAPISRPSVIPQPPMTFPSAPMGAPAQAPAPEQAPWYPRTRKILRDDFNTRAKLLALIERMPPEFGTYKPHADTRVKNIQTHIIEMIKARVPMY